MKLLVYFTSERLFKSFFDLGYISEIKRFYPNVRFVCMVHDLNWQVPTTIDYSEFYIDFFSENSFNKKVGNFVLDFFTYINREKSVSFQTKIRILAEIPTNKTISFKTFVFQFKLRWLLISVLGFGFLKKMNGKILSYFLDKFFSSSIIFKNFLPDIFLLISGGPFSNVENSTIFYANKKNLKCALIIDNWDNLSSKSIIWRKPDLLGVWGPNMVEDAINIHTIDNNSISIIGSSRIFEYPGDNSKEVHPYVLFAGSSTHTDRETELIQEIELVKIAHAILAKLGIKLLYRPHPGSRGINPVDMLDLEQLDHLDYLDLAHESNFYSFESLSSLIFQCKSAVFVIGTHSTVIVESLSIGKKVISYSGTRSPYFHNKDIFNGYKHLQELNDNTNLEICRNLDEFHYKVKSLAEDFKHGRLSNHGTNFVPDILPDFQNSYKDRLTEFIHKIEKLSKY